MPITLVTGPANAGKAQVVLDAVRAHTARGEGPLLVVPTEADQARYRRELAEGGGGYSRDGAGVHGSDSDSSGSGSSGSGGSSSGGSGSGGSDGGGRDRLVMGVRVERFAGLLEEVLRRSQLEQPPLGPLARKRLLASLAERHLGGAAGEWQGFSGAIGAGPDPSGAVDPGPGVSTAIGAGPGLPGGGHGIADALGEAVAELQTVRIAPDRLGEAVRRCAADSASSSRSLEMVCEVFGAYQQTLARIGRADAEQRGTGALDRLRRTPSLWGSTPVLLYGFDSFTELQLDAIETLGSVVDAPLTVALPYEPGRRAFAGRAAALHRLSPLASARVQLPSRAEHYAPRSRAALHRLERSLFEDASTVPAPGQAVNGNPAPGQAVNGSRAPGQAMNGSRATGARAEPEEAVRLLQGSSPREELELVASEARALIDGGVGAEELAIVHRSPEAVSALLAEALDDRGVPHSVRPRLRFAHTAIGRALLGALRCALGDGQLGDLLAWLRAPGVLSRPQLADRLEAHALRHGLSAEQACAVWEAERWPLERIERLRSRAQEGVVRLLPALAAELEKLFYAPRRGLGAVLDEQQRLEAVALAAGRRALEELRELARMAPEHAGGPAEALQLLSELELSDGRRPAEGGVALVDPLSLRARRVRVLFVCGMQEGVFPAPAAARPLLGQEQRRRLALASGLLLPAESSPLDSERYLFYALCSRPEERLVLSWHTAAEDGSPAARSLFMDDVCDLFAPASLERETVREPPAGPPAPAIPMACPAPAAQSQPAPIQPLRHERVLEELAGRALWSASALESFNACPVRWFVERLLRAEPLDPDPEPLARGALAHAALRKTLEELREQTGSARITAASLPEAKRLLARALYEEPHERPLSVLAERIAGVQRRLQSDLERYLEWAAEQEDDLEPSCFELEFGMEESPVPTLAQGAAPEQGPVPTLEPDAVPAQGSAPMQEQGAVPALALSEEVSVRGRIDRIDLSPEGEAVVYDYKARTAPPAAKWVGDGALQVALYMRATERLLGHPVAGGFYQPLSGKDLRPRGVLDAAAAAQIGDCVRTDRREREELQELLAQCEKLALRAAEQARAGNIEPRPATCTPGGGCLYPTICRCES